MRLAQHLSSRASRVQFTAPDIEAARAVEGRIRLVEELMETRGISKVWARDVEWLCAMRSSTALVTALMWLILIVEYPPH
jgi:hypothetical protein